jgi:hypothetical protein
LWAEPHRSVELKIDTLVDRAPAVEVHLDLPLRLCRRRGHRFEVGGGQLGADLGLAEGAGRPAAPLRRREPRINPDDCSLYTNNPVAL